MGVVVHVYSPSYSGGWGRRIAWNRKTEVAVSRDLTTALQPGKERDSVSKTNKQTNKQKNKTKTKKCLVPSPIPSLLLSPCDMPIPALPSVMSKSSLRSLGSWVMSVPCLCLQNCEPIKPLFFINYPVSGIPLQPCKNDLTYCFIIFLGQMPSSVRFLEEGSP